MATNEVDIIGIDPPAEDENNRNEQLLPPQGNYVGNTGVSLFPSIRNNFKLRSDTGNTSNESYTTSDSLLTQYIKVQSKMKWKFLPEQQAGCLLRGNQADLGGDPGGGTGELDQISELQVSERGPYCSYGTAGLRTGTQGGVSATLKT